MNRRTFLVGAAGLATLPLTATAQAETIQLTPTALPTPDPGATPTPTSSRERRELFRGDSSALWNAPWEIGSMQIEIGCTIVKRFIGTESEGYALGEDGLVFRSVIYAKHGFQQMLFIGVNSDLKELQGVHTIVVNGRYGGVQHNTDSGWEDPILIAEKIVVP